MCNKPPRNIEINNPLIQLITNTKTNYLMFYTQMNDGWTNGGGNWCVICGIYELQIIPMDVRRQTSMCLDCYNIKIKLDNQIEKMLRPYKLTQEIFGIKTKGTTNLNIIPIQQLTNNG